VLPLQRRNMRDLLLATANKGKIPQLLAGLNGVPFNIKSLNDVLLPSNLVVEEPGSTYEAHAIIKAFVYGKHANMLALADDSGMEIDAFPDAMGVHTAHYFTGTRAENVANLLEMMKDVPHEQRTCRYRAVIAIYDPVNDNVRFAEGVTEGYVTTESKGDGGFGYDQIFFSADAQKTFGEMEHHEIDKVSHRGRALKAAREILVKEFV
jgi:non-canonical purine NTP pyrophosphatase (RdgB/HAM1 family)